LKGAKLFKDPKKGAPKAYVKKSSNKGKKPNTAINESEEMHSVYSDEEPSHSIIEEEDENLLNEAELERRMSKLIYNDNSAKNIKPSIF